MEYSEAGSLSWNSYVRHSCGLFESPHVHPTEVKAPNGKISTATGSLQTELRNEKSSNIDIVTTLEMCRIMNDADSEVAVAVRTCLPEIARTIDLVADRLRKGGRVFYIGAGTSGRLGVLDASEIPPTFSAPYTLFIALMAGGDSAIRSASEGAEDSETQPIGDLQKIEPPLSDLDTLIGIAASGRTPYVLAGLSYCRQSLGMLTVGISCVNPSGMRGRCECLVECLVGPEIITGSTRMKAGTATKMILNMISTGVMIRVGKTHGNLMVDVKATNGKLIDRARRIFKTVIPYTPLLDTEIDSLIQRCNGSVKLAIVVEALKCSVVEATRRLDGAEGILKRALEIVVDETPLVESHEEPRLVLCIDAGGTKCTAVISSKDGVLARAEAGPCNFVTLGHDSALSSISTAVVRAVALLPGLSRPPGSLVSLPFSRPIFAAAWVGGAGLDRPADLASVQPRLAHLLSLSDPSALLVTNDAALLSSALLNHKISGSPLSQTGVVLVLGTGSIAYSFHITSAERKLITVPLERTGGWGYLLGDEGSAYFIGREAIRRTLRHRDQGFTPTRLHKIVADYFGCHTIGAIISAVYTPNQFQEKTGTLVPMASDPKLRIASLAPLVVHAAFPTNSEIPDQEALSIVRQAAITAVDVVEPLLRDKSQILAQNSTLAMGGALAQIPEFRNLVVNELRERGEHFAHVEAVADAAGCAVQILVKNFLT